VSEGNGHKPDLSKLSDAELFQTLVRILASPGEVSERELADLAMIEAEIKRREHVKRRHAHYTPTEEDLDWARNAVALVANGGILAFASARLHYRVNQKERVMTLGNPEMLFFLDSFITHIQTIDTFAAIGWRVEPGRDTLERLGL